MEHKKGTTTIGLVTNDAVILAADKKASLGHLAMHKVVKVEKITDDIAMTTAGSVADAQMLVKYLQAEMQLYSLDTGSDPTIETAASLLSTILYGGKGYFPYMVQLLMGGKSKDGSMKVYSLFGDGSSISDTFTATGSGTELALAVIQTNYKKDISTEDGINLAAKAINTAIQRDIFSGEGIDIVVIDKKGFRRVSEKAVATALKK